MKQPNFYDQSGLDRMSERRADTEWIGALLKAGYKAYVEHMVSRFAPTFLAISIEVNMYAQACPGAWEDVKQLLNEVYVEQKARRPELLVFNTYQIDFLWEAGRDQRCFGFSTSSPSSIDV